MDIDTRTIVIGKLLDEAMDIAFHKGKAYSGSDDSLDNFKRNGRNLGLTKYQVLSVYMNKHLDTINNAIKDKPEFPEDGTEGMKGRIVDAINYLGILWALIQEDLWTIEKNLNTSPTRGTSQQSTTASGKKEISQKSNGSSMKRKAKASIS